MVGFRQWIEGEVGVRVLEFCRLLIYVIEIQRFQYLM